MTIVEAFSAIAKERAEVIIVSDDHNEMEWAKEKSKIVFKVLKESHPKLDCLFLEHPAELQVSLEDFENSKLSWEGYVQAAVSTLGEAAGESPPANEHFLNFFQYKNELASLAKSYGIKLFAVDASIKEQLANNQSFLQGLLDRNGVMARNIAQLMLQRKCTQGVLFVGDAHVLWTPGEHQKKLTVSQHLADAQFDVATVVARKISDAFKDTPFGYTEASCRDPSLLPPSPFAIMSNSKEVPIYEGHLSNPTVSEFASTVEGIPLRPLDQSMIRAWFFY